MPSEYAFVRLMENKKTKFTCKDMKLYAELTKSVRGNIKNTS